MIDIAESKDKHGRIPDPDALSAAGEPVKGLVAENFEVMDKGVRQEIAAVVRHLI